MKAVVLGDVTGKSKGWVAAATINEVVPVLDCVGTSDLQASLFGH